MARMNVATKSVDEYIAAQPKEIAVLLKKMRLAIRSAAPKAEEGIAYGMPGYKLNGPLVYFGGFKKHVSFFPTSLGVKAFKKELAPYLWSKGTIQFPLDKPLPLALVKRIVRFRVKENKERLAKKKR